MIRLGVHMMGAMPRESACSSKTVCIQRTFAVPKWRTPPILRLSGCDPLQPLRRSQNDSGRSFDRLAGLHLWLLVGLSMLPKEHCSSSDRSVMKGSKQEFERFCRSKGWHPDAWWDMWLVWQAAVRWHEKNNNTTEGKTVNPEDCLHAKMQCVACGDRFSRQDGIQ